MKPKTEPLAILTMIKREMTQIIRNETRTSLHTVHVLKVYLRILLTTLNKNLTTSGKWNNSFKDTPTYQYSHKKRNG